MGLLESRNRGVGKYKQIEKATFSGNKSKKIAEQRACISWNMQNHGTVNKSLYYYCYVWENREMIKIDFKTI